MSQSTHEQTDQQAGQTDQKDQDQKSRQRSEKERGARSTDPQFEFGQMGIANPGSLLGSMIEHEQQAAWQQAYFDLAEATLRSSRRVAEVTVLGQYRQALAASIVAQVVPQITAQLREQIRAEVKASLKGSTR